MISSEEIPLSRASLVGGEWDYVRDVVESRQLSGPGQHTLACEALIREQTGATSVFLVPSCTAALEMSASLLDIGPGHEVIMPTFTFVSNANAVVLRGATPVFVDVDPVTFNIDPDAIRHAIGPKTRAVFVTDYAGVPGDIDSITRIADEHGVRVVEDAAQSYGSRRNGKAAGTLAPLGCFSFHGTKNVVGGEAGALVVNDPALAARAAILREKGTNRTRFMAGEVDFYTWIDTGSSQLVSELTAAFLRAQLEQAAFINSRRLELWRHYRDELSELAGRGLFRLPSPPADVEHNAHIFFLVLPSRQQRDDLAAALKARGISAYWHYVPLHSSPGGKKYGRASGPMAGTQIAADCLLRLPLFHDLGPDQDRVIAAIRDWAAERKAT